MKKSYQVRRVVFIGGILLESQSSQIEAASKVAVQHAADALQKAILNGFSLHDDIDISAINLPFIGSFPRADRALRFSAITEQIFSRIAVTGMAFTNIMILRNGSRYRATLRRLEQEIGAGEECTIVIYSAHIPFINAALKFRKSNPGARICLILPDFIEFMGATSFRRRLMNTLSIRAFYKAALKIDHFMVLTAAMAERLQLRPEQFTVIEGIYDPQDDARDPEWSEEPGPVFIYTGTLAARYGILDLLAAFSQLTLPSARLWVCGDGDARAAVEELARQDPRVTYHGRVTRAAVLALQARAHVMVNPRRPEGEFTRYSFPSKTMEYLASGRPVVMHWLPGIPEEYRPWLITPATGDAAGLAAAMAEVAARPAEELRRIGAAGRAFVLERKTPRIQVGSLLDGLFPDHRGRD